LTFDTNGVLSGKLRISLHVNWCHETARILSTTRKRSQWKYSLAFVINDGLLLTSYDHTKINISNRKQKKFNQKITSAYLNSIKKSLRYDHYLEKKSILGVEDVPELEGAVLLKLPLGRTIILQSDRSQMDDPDDSSLFLNTIKSFISDITASTILSLSNKSTTSSNHKDKKVTGSFSKPSPITSRKIQKESEGTDNHKAVQINLLEQSQEESTEAPRKRSVSDESKQKLNSKKPEDKPKRKQKSSRSKGRTLTSDLSRSSQVPKHTNLSPKREFTPSKNRPVPRRSMTESQLRVEYDSTQTDNSDVKV